MPWTAYRLSRLHEKHDMYKFESKDEPLDCDKWWIKALLSQLNEDEKQRRIGKRNLVFRISEDRLFSYNYRCNRNHFMDKPKEKLSSPEDSGESKSYVVLCNESLFESRPLGIWASSNTPKGYLEHIISSGQDNRMRYQINQDMLRGSMTL